MHALPEAPPPAHPAPAHSPLRRHPDLTTTCAMRADHPARGRTWKVCRPSGQYNVWDRLDNGYFIYDGYVVSSPGARLPFRPGPNSHGRLGHEGDGPASGSSRRDAAPDGPRRPGRTARARPILSSFLLLRSFGDSWCVKDAFPERPACTPGGSYFAGLPFEATMSNGCHACSWVPQIRACLVTRHMS
jgi:hypothetical protein